LGQHGVNIGQFVQQFNASTNALNGTKVTVVITVYKDKSFTFDVKSPPASVLLKEAAQIAKGSGLAGRETIATVTRAQAQEIAQRKLEDLNAASLAAATRMVEGTARSIGIEVVEG
jgi:large subunit ribosomal protein L11